MAYTVQDGRLVNIVAFVHDYTLEGSTPPGPSVGKASKNDLLVHFGNWEPEVAQMMNVSTLPPSPLQFILTGSWYQCVDQAMLWQINVVPSLPTYVGKRVVLLGDAVRSQSVYIFSSP